MKNSQLIFLAFTACMETEKNGSDSGSDSNSISGAEQMLDILFVIDNSCSMADENAAIAAGLNSFTGNLGESDYQIAVTTVGVEENGGLFQGSPTIFNADNIDPGFSETIDALGSTGVGSEEPLEAALLALCRQSSSPPATCFETPSSISEDDANSNESFLREGSKFAFVVITDEGDTSRRLSMGDGDTSLYHDAYNEFGNEIIAYVIGPEYDSSNGSVTCNEGGAQSWGVERFHNITSATGGLHLPLQIQDSNGNCSPADIENHIIDIATHLSTPM